jgi:hypothetical protein
MFSTKERIYNITRTLIMARAKRRGQVPPWP